MTKVRKQIILFLFAFTLAFGVVAVLNTDYTFAASKPAIVKNLKVVKYSTNKVKLTFSKAKRAKKYKIYRKIGTGSWKLVKTTKSRKLYFTQNQVDSYSWRVRAVNGKKKGSYSSKKEYRLPTTNYSGYNIIKYGGLFVINSCWYSTDDGYYAYNDSNRDIHAATYCQWLQKPNIGWTEIDNSGEDVKYYAPFEKWDDSVTWLKSADGSEYVAVSILSQEHQDADNHSGNIQIDCYKKAEVEEWLKLNAPKIN